MNAEPAYLFADAWPERDARRAAITAHYLADETALVDRLLSIARLAPPAAEAIANRAADWVRRVRRLRDAQSPLDAFMQQYDLSSEEGVLLMCLAEALLRIPDDETAEKLIADKLANADWEAHLGASDSLFVNASTWGLMLTGRIVRLSPETTGNFRAAINRMISKSTEPVIRMAIRQAMRLMGSQFVMGRTIQEALRNARAREQRRYLHSFDMLGEAALTAGDAERYFDAYQQAIAAIGASAESSHDAPVFGRPGISVKLSALHPRYAFAQRGRVLDELTPRLRRLVQLAQMQNIGLTVDAEEADRLELSLDVFEAVFRDVSIGPWEGFGLAVQAFQKRGLFVIDWLEQLARTSGRRIPVRLVKGAYWDTEIKRAQEQGLPGYPVFTRKANTDVAYMACARRLLAARDAFYPMLATHNAHTVAAVRAYAGDDSGYEFQRLHGMGEALYRVVGEDLPVPCRVYAPVGSHEDLLPYLVRRLLENGANTSFVNRIFDEQVPPEQLVEDPVTVVARLAVKPNPNLPLPVDLYGAARRNSHGLNLADESVVVGLQAALGAARPPQRATSLLACGEGPGGEVTPVLDPADHRRRLGEWVALPVERVPEVVAAALGAQARWNALAVDQRAAMLERAADRLEERHAEFMRLLIREAGKTVTDAVSEVREAVDFLRYYAASARRLMAHPEVLPGPTGEHNELQLHGKGVFVCISPWNFPLAIFTGQIAAALVTGNTVIAKPAEQTNLVAFEMVRLLHACGVPRDVLQLVLGAGALGATLVADPRIAGVAFTGSVEVAQAIHRTLAARPGPIATLIAETGGQNAMIVDSSALPEQVVKDVIHSAFLSAGQRCSALRVLYLQHEIADKTLAMLRGAMRELVIGDPGLLATDIGPVIDADARTRLEAHASAIKRVGRPIEHLAVPPSCLHGTYFPPCAVEIDGIEQLRGEHFGPILHVVRYAAADVEAVVDAINATGYGLTLGVHSRIESTWRRIQARARVGNCYVNRGMTGAVVGVQPFGGEGLSGTGPKAGGPHYLLRFVTERTLTVNTAAVGGNARLLAASG
ncbi:L-proline dehydrogenase /delta-1-pyrroline-5-carboxylate dehydrogenase [Fontimonas thermophila]|uniref:Bifunctional protein PutA n=1 Tax=Fontimonas thermophila TaxID=1076937 RepID=A0A1I2J5D8_9GAMM|nr:bifunctional proline dehydrogenase/L-glutamate gamma-semialdehyde dehydrogenase PutA [Fontimonas thermophila]SFF48166.1 L-proline dehydrogenase /delta-1-pyrroline-5-carboxylate dehydrogenase [Fontimonas thermophila]